MQGRKKQTKSFKKQCTVVVVHTTTSCYAAEELGRNPESKHQIQPEDGESRLTRDGTASRETQFSGANADREIFIFPVQLTTSRIGNLTRLILPLAIYVTSSIHTVHKSTSSDRSPTRDSSLVGLFVKAPPLKQDLGSSV